MGGLGTWEILIIFLIILLVFGAKRIPEIARGLGKGIREFKDATTEIKNELNVDDSRNRIQNPRPPQHGSTAPRAESYHTPAESHSETRPQTGTKTDRPAAADQGEPDTNRVSG